MSTLDEFIPCTLAAAEIATFIGQPAPPGIYSSLKSGVYNGQAVYGTCIGNALKWFPDRRGLAAGLTAAGFGAGSALTIIPIRNMIAGSGYEPTFLWFGVGQGVIVFVLSFALRAPRTDEVPVSARVVQSARSYTPLEMVAITSGMDERDERKRTSDQASKYVRRHQNRSLSPVP